VSDAVLDIPQTAVTPLVLRHAERLGERPALVDAGGAGTITYGELPGLIGRMAAALRGLGLGRGDVLALVLPNVPEFVVAFHAAATLGAIVTPVNPAFTPGEVRRQLGDSGARLVVTLPELLEGAAAAAEGTAVGRVVALGDPLLQEGGGEIGQVPVDPARDLVALPYSSGTTGFAKGVMLTHRNLVANVLQVERVFGLGESDTVAAVLPFFHIYGLTVNMNLALARGATVVTMRRFELDAFLDAVERHRVTRAFLVPPILLALAKHPAVDRHDTSSLRVIVSGAAPLDGDLARACAARVGCAVYQGYGLTEASPVTHLPPDGPEAGAHPDSVGPALPGTECRAVDPTTRLPLPTGADGEIAVRGPQVMQGYLHDPEATALAIDADGWLHTGDLGHIDAGGRLHIVDRLKELIKVRGFQVAPAELEAVLVSHPAVADAAVIPVTDRRGNEAPKALVVLREPVEAAELQRFVAERVAPHKRLRRVEVIDAVPRTASGKILRRVLIERERDRGREPGG
jgi:acyl-CoA synthetase (AMP-forming)/AMP-acid ligase II